MDGIHDMGGMHGFGAVDPADDGVAFHGRWQGRMFALSRVVRFNLPFGGDHVRKEIERLDPAHYMASSYYEKWLEGNIANLRRIGVVTEEELAGGALRPLPEALGQPRAMPPAEAARVILAGMPGAARPSIAGRYRAGDRVRTICHGIEGHTRLPRYARGRPGVVLAVRGAFPVADAVAAGRPETEMVYTVEFLARDLWVDSEAGDGVTLDLWERYIEGPA
jgi:nitrile hydratase